MAAAVACWARGAGRSFAPLVASAAGAALGGSGARTLGSGLRRPLAAVLLAAPPPAAPLPLLAPRAFFWSQSTCGAAPPLAAPSLPRPPPLLCRKSDRGGDRDSAYEHCDCDDLCQRKTRDEKRNRGREFTEDECLEDEGPEKSRWVAAKEQEEAAEVQASSAEESIAEAAKCETSKAEEAIAEAAQAGAAKAGAAKAETTKAETAVKGPKKPGVTPPKKGPRIKRIKALKAAVGVTPGAVHKEADSSQKFKNRIAALKKSSLSTTKGSALSGARKASNETPSKVVIFIGQQVENLIRLVKKMLSYAAGFVKKKAPVVKKAAVNHLNKAEYYILQKACKRLEKWKDKSKLAASAPEKGTAKDKGGTGKMMSEAAKKAGEMGQKAGSGLKKAGMKAGEVAKKTAEDVKKSGVKETAGAAARKAGEEVKKASESIKKTAENVRKTGAKHAVGALFGKAAEKAKKAGQALKQAGDEVRAKKKTSVKPAAEKDESANEKGGGDKE